MNVILIDYEPFGSFAAEEAAAAAIGLTLTTVSREEFASGDVRGPILLNPAGHKLTRPELEHAGCSLAIGYGVGTDWISPADAAALDLTVLGMPGSNADDVAVHTLTLILACVRRIRTLDCEVRRGGFDWTVARPLLQPTELTVGMLAFGNIPQSLVRLSSGLGFSFAAFDPRVPDETFTEAGVVRLMSADALLRASDVLSVHLPSTPETRRFLNRGRIRLLPDGAAVVITGRGDTYDDHALAEALSCGRLRACAVDVFPAEPPPPDSLLLACEGAIFTPHMAGLSEHTIADQHRIAARFIREHGPLATG